MCGVLFKVHMARCDFLERYEVQTVGGSHFQKHRIPAVDLAEFNRDIVGKIEVINTFSDCA
jgi:hypothetical protein